METTSKSQKSHDAIALCIKALNREADVQDIDKKVLDDPARLKQCKKAIKNASLKRELG